MKPCVKCGAFDRYDNGVCKPCQRACNAAWYAANQDRVKTNSTAWQAANRDKVRTYGAAYKAANPDKEHARSAAWRAANPERVRIYSQNRRGRKRDAGGKLSSGLAARLFDLQRGKCACGCKQPLGDDYHMDHIMPLALGGINTDDNIQLLRSFCNRQKGSKHPINFMQQRGFLL